MQELILEILKKVELDKEYLKLCQDNCDFNGRYNLTRKEAEPIIKSFDLGFKYISNDRVFMKETAFEEFKVRFFIGFRGGITSFGYLIWREGEINSYHKGNLYTLSKQINPEFEDKLESNCPIVASLDDFKDILSKFFELFEYFKQCFEKAIKN